jgi:hypothetical protein
MAGTLYSSESRATDVEFIWWALGIVAVSVMLGLFVYAHYLRLCDWTCRNCGYLGKGSDWVDGKCPNCASSASKYHPKTVSHGFQGTKDERRP